MPEIKAIILDLGGVLLNLDYARTDQAFRELGIPHFGSLYSQHKTGTLFHDLETGSISVPAFLDALKQESSLKPDNQQLIDAWNAMLLDFPEERIHLLRRLRKKYPLYLLSNTNAIHVEAFNRSLKATCGLDSLDSLFEKLYYSHLIGARKPDLAAFRYVIRENNLTRPIPCLLMILPAT